MEKGVYEKEMGPIKIEVKNIEDELLDIDGNLHQIQGEVCILNLCFLPYWIFTDIML